jgi:hypothetical protein
MTPLHVHVVLSEHVVTALIKAKAKVDAFDLQGSTSLHCLAECSSKYSYPNGLSFASITAIASFLIQASGGTVLFLKNNKGKLPSQLGSNRQLRSFLQGQEYQLKDVSNMVELRPCLQALAGGSTWTEAPQESLRNVPVSKLQREKVKISEMDTMLKILLRVLRTTPHLEMLDRSLIRKQLITVQQQIDRQLTVHDHALDGLVSIGDPDENTKIACRRLKREKVVKDLGFAMRSLVAVVNDLIAALSIQSQTATQATAGPNPQSSLRGGLRGGTGGGGGGGGR